MTKRIFSPNRRPISLLAMGVLVLGVCAMLALNAPGQLSMDSILQLRDGRSGSYNSWHPPVMAWLLGGFDALLPGTLLYLLFASAAVVAALAILLCLPGRDGPLSWLVLAAFLLTPQWLLYQGIVWKDVLFANAALLGFAALAAASVWWRARWRWLGLSLVALVLASLTRQNGLVLLPVAALTLGLIARQRMARGLAWGGGFLALSLGLTLVCGLALARKSDGGEGASSEIRLAQVYDLAGALARDPTLPLPVLENQAPELARLLRTRGARLYTPLRNDPISADPALNAAIADAPPAAVMRQWLQLPLSHPGTYLAARMGVFWQTLATPDIGLCHPLFAGVDGPPGIVQALGLTSGRRPQDRALLAYGGAFEGTPVLSHLLFAALCLVLLIALARRGQPQDIAVAGLLAGALVFALSFLVISIACDYRYLYMVDLAAMAGGLHWARKPVKA